MCLQVGCIPSKALIELADAAQRTRDLHAAGLSVDGMTVSLERFQAWRGELCAGLARGVGRLLDAGDVRVVHGEARFNRADRVAVRTPEDGVVFFEFEHAIVATGSRPVALPGLPFDGERVLDSTGALALTAIPASVVVVGAGYIGLELGTALAKLGARVTVVEALDRILPTVDESLTAPVLERLRELDVELWLETRAQRLEDGALVVAGPGGEDRVEAERVIVAVGRVPNTDELGLAEAGVVVGPDGLIAVGEDMRATERIAAVGDVVAGPALAHKATAEAAVAAEALSGQPAAFDAQAIPIVIFTDPEIGSVGLSEAQARDAGLDPVVATFPLAASGRAGDAGRARGLHPDRRGRRDRPRRGRARRRPARQRARCRRCPGDRADGCARRRRRDHPPTPDAQRGAARGGRADAGPSAARRTGAGEGLSGACVRGSSVLYGAARRRTAASRGGSERRSGRCGSARVRVPARRSVHKSRVVSQHLPPRRRRRTSVLPMSTRGRTDVRCGRRKGVAKDARMCTEAPRGPEDDGARPDRRSLASSRCCCLAPRSAAGA